MTRKYLLIGTAALLAAVLVVWFLLRDAQRAGKKKTASATSQTAGGEGRVSIDQRRFRPKTSKESPRIDTQKMSKHATSIDRKYGRLAAVFNAKGNGPCDTFYNATVAERKAAAETGYRSIFTFVAERSEFMKVCKTLSPAAKRCLNPRYTTANREECKVARPPSEVLNRMVKVRQNKLDEDDPRRHSPDPATDERK